MSIIYAPATPLNLITVVLHNQTKYRMMTHDTHSHPICSAQTKPLKFPIFPDEIADNMSNKCIILIQILCEHIQNIAYSTNKVPVSYFVQMPQSHFPDYTNSLTLPWLWGLLPDLRQNPWHFQVSTNSRKVVTLLQLAILWVACRDRLRQIHRSKAVHATHQGLTTAEWTLLKNRNTQALLQKQSQLAGMNIAHNCPCSTSRIVPTMYTGLRKVQKILETLVNW